MMTNIIYIVTNKNSEPKKLRKTLKNMKKSEVTSLFLFLFWNE